MQKKDFTYVLKEKQNSSLIVYKNTIQFKYSKICCGYFNYDHSLFRNAWVEKQISRIPFTDFLPWEN
jgi:hypothetical protein